jgi:hypothetical protein
LTDLLLIEGGKIEVRNTAGQVRFTTDEPMFHVLNSVEGSHQITFPFNPATSPYERITTYTLASGLNVAATHVVGVLQTTGDSYGRLPGGTWFDAGGTYAHRQHWWTDNTSGTFGQAETLQHLVHYTFRVDAGVLYLDEDVRFADYLTGGLPSGLPVSLDDFTITFKLKVGLFT